MKLSEKNSGDSTSQNIRIPGMFEIIREFITVIVGIGTLLTASGFVVVTTYVKRYTDITGLKISPREFLIAGVYFILYAIPIVAVIVALIALSKLPRIFQKYPFVKLYEKFRTSLWFRISSSLMFLFFVIWFLVIGGGYLYGTYIYDNNGAVSSEIILIIKPNIDISSLGLQSNPIYSRQTLPLLLIVALDDGVLVGNPATRQVLAIKDDAIEGIIDTTESKILLDQFAPTIVQPTSTSGVVIPTPTP